MYCIEMTKECMTPKWKIPTLFFIPTIYMLTSCDKKQFDANAGIANSRVNPKFHPTLEEFWDKHGNFQPMQTTSPSRYMMMEEWHE